MDGSEPCVTSAGNTLLANGQPPLKSERKRRFQQSVRRVSRQVSQQGRTVLNLYRQVQNFTGLHQFIVFIPILAGVIPAIFIGISLGVAVHQSNLYPKPIPRGIIPYISDIGNLKPQSSVFTFGLTVGSLFTLATVILRYYQGKIMFETRYSRMNYAVYVIGWLLVAGKVIVCTFQLSSSPIIHYLGAFMYVFMSFIYCGFQTFFSYKHPGIHSLCLIRFRLVATAGMTIGALIFAIFMIPALHRFNRGGPYVAQGGEWFFASLKMAFFLTFFYDFKLVRPSFKLIPVPREGYSHKKGSQSRRYHPQHSEFWI